MTGDLCPFCGAYATSACEFEDDTDNCPWEEAQEAECPHCEDGLVWKSKYGGNDPDAWSEPCPECSGPDPDQLREQRDENRRLAKEGGEHG